MESHPSPMIARSGPDGSNGGGTQPNGVRGGAAVNVLIFLRTLYWNLSRGIHSRSFPDAFDSTLRGADFLLLRCRGDLRRAIRGFREGGCGFAGECDVPARIIGGTAG